MSGLNIADYNRKGQVFCAANTAAKSVIAVTTSMTGVILYNPAGSGKKLVLLHAGWVWTTAPAAVHNIGIALASPNVTVPTTLTAIGSGVVAADGSGSGGASVARAYDAAALPVAPVIVRWSFGATYGSGVGESPAALIDYIDGALVLVPGAVATFAAGTTTAVGMGSSCWAEVPV
mgnify:CR=1 FL=1